MEAPKPSADAGTCTTAWKEEGRVVFVVAHVLQVRRWEGGRPPVPGGGFVWLCVGGVHRRVSYSRHIALRGGEVGDSGAQFCFLKCLLVRAFGLRDSQLSVPALRGSRLGGSVTHQPTIVACPAEDASKLSVATELAHSLNPPSPFRVVPQQA